MRQLRLIAVGVLALVISGCSAYRWEQPAPVVSRSTQPAHQDMTPSKRGNPPFYEVFGVRYQVMDSSVGYKERGIASWYGPKFHGRLTSSGERYDMHRMTAAHKSLPLPTNVRVTNLENGKSVIVRVNDRGPFVKGRIIDLSFVAAQAIDMTQAGTARVEVEALQTSYTGAITAAAAVSPAAGDTTRQPHAAARDTLTEPADAAPIDESRAPQTDAAIVVAATGPSIPASRPLMYVQVGAFGEAGNARNLAARLTGEGVTGVTVHESTADEAALYRVRIGPFTDIAEYDRIVAKVAALQIATTQLVVEDDAATSRL